MRTREERIAMIRAARAEAERKRRKRERYCDCTGSGPDAACTGRCNPNVPDDDFEEAFGDPPGEPPEHDLEMRNGPTLSDRPALLSATSPDDVTSGTGRNTLFGNHDHYSKITRPAS